MGYSNQNPFGTSIGRVLEKLKFLLIFMRYRAIFPEGIACNSRGPVRARICAIPGDWKGYA